MGYKINHSSKLSCAGSAIVGVASCVPKEIVPNEFFCKNFSNADIENIAKMTGVKQRRWVVSESTSDLCLAAGKHLLDKLGWHPDSIDGLIFITQTPDFILPATSIRIQGGLGLTNCKVALDINLGCSGYPYGLWLAMNMIQGGGFERILVAVGETPSKIVNQFDRSTAMLFGDAGTMTAIEKTDMSDAAHFIFGADSNGQSSLIIPNTRFSSCRFSENDKFNDVDLNHLYMDGSDVFNFTLRLMPDLIGETIKLNEKIDYYFFHQANLFLLNHLIKKSKIDSAKVPINIADYGNTSSASIPLLMSTGLDINKLKNSNVAMFGFGVGFSWGSASLYLKHIKVLDNILI